MMMMMMIIIIIIIAVVSVSLLLTLFIYATNCSHRIFFSSIFAIKFRTCFGYSRLSRKHSIQKLVFAEGFYMMCTLHNLPWSYFPYERLVHSISRNISKPVLNVGHVDSWEREKT